MTHSFSIRKKLLSSALAVAAASVIGCGTQAPETAAPPLQVNQDRIDSHGCFPDGAKKSDGSPYCISGPIREYWQNNGGLRQFGYPLSDPQRTTVYYTDEWENQQPINATVQWFERERLEIHHDGPFAASRRARGEPTVEAGRVGDEYLRSQNINWVWMDKLTRSIGNGQTELVYPNRPDEARARGCRVFRLHDYDVQIMHTVCHHSPDNPSSGFDVNFKGQTLRMYPDFLSYYVNEGGCVNQPYQRSSTDCRSRDLGPLTGVPFDVYHERFGYPLTEMIDLEERYPGECSQYEQLVHSFNSLTGETRPYNGLTPDQIRDAWVDVPDHCRARILDTGITPYNPETGKGVKFVQYFERRRMEFHPENYVAKNSYDILLGRLGAALMPK